MSDTVARATVEQRDAPADPPPPANEELVCTLCGLTTCWPARPGKSEGEPTR